MFFCRGIIWVVAVILFLYAGHSVDVAVAEFRDSEMELSCLSENSDVHTLNHIYLRIVARCVPQMFLLILCL